MPTSLLTKPDTTHPLHFTLPHAAAAAILGCLFVFVLGTVLVNALVSIMTNTLDKVGCHS